ncbi:MAG: hypothetical protein JSV97_13040, partial [candidate division WOR-3 bacterium]
YPDICRLDTIGYSVQGRPIWAMRVTDNPLIEENEAEIRLLGNVHGDEHIGTEITLYFLRQLLTNYGLDPQVQNLINNREVWVLPSINPDGKVANTRSNANWVDLNRDYGYFWDGWGGSPAPLSQIENQVMAQHLEENNITLEYNYHSLAFYVNYPWDYHQSDPPDSDYIITLSEIYADSANLVAINGYDWYQVCGSLQDYTVGISGALAWTIETDEPGGSSAIDQICYENRDALMDVCERAGWGIEGVVKDSVTDAPLFARIEFLNSERIDIYTDPYLGDFHKMIEPGTYDIRVSTNGYAPKIISTVVAPDTGSIFLDDILLAPESSYLYAFRPVLCRFADQDIHVNKTQPRFALGQEDGRFFSLGRSGYVVLDMGPHTPITDITGSDFTVYEGNDGTAEGYTVYASNNWDGPWNSCGSATGTASFDLAATGLGEARYLRIVDDGSSSSGQYAGFDLEAVQFFTQTGIGEDARFTILDTGYRLMVYPNPFTEKTKINYGIGQSAKGSVPKGQESSSFRRDIELKIFDISGKLIKDFLLSTNYSATQYGGLLPTSIEWDGTDQLDRKVPAGIYFVQLKAGDYRRIEKAVLLR